MRVWQHGWTSNSLRLLGLLLVCPLTCQAAPPTDQEIRRAIQDLTDDRFAVRQQAFQVLEAAGDRAESLLRAAVRSEDAEVERQARVLLKRIVAHPAPHLPSEIIHRLHRFLQSSDKPVHQAQILRSLLEEGEGAHSLVFRLLDTCTRDQQRLIFDELAKNNWEVLSCLSAQGHDSFVFQLALQAIEVECESVILHFTFLVAHRGEFDAYRSHFQRLLQRRNRDWDARVAAALARHTADVELAQLAARRMQDETSVRHILVDMGRWSELSDYLKSRPHNTSTIAELGFQLTVYRLAARDSDTAQVLQQIENLVGEPRFRGRSTRSAWNVAKVLLLNEETDRALAILNKAMDTRAMVEVLWALGRLQQAMQLSDTAARTELGNRTSARLAHIDRLLRLGQKEQAREWLQQVKSVPGEVSESLRREVVVECLIRLGLSAAAEQIVRESMGLHDSPIGPLLAALEPRLGPDAEIIFRLTAQAEPSSTWDERIAQLRALADERLSRDALVRLVRQPVPKNPLTGTKCFEDVARLVLRYSLVEVASDLLNHPAWAEAPTEAWICLADTLAESERWTEAVSAYRRCWEREPRRPLPLFLAAQALRRTTPGHPNIEAWIRQSHQISLGDVAARRDFYLALQARGFREDADLELRLSRNLDDGTSWASLELADQHARRLAATGREDEAARLLQGNLARLVRPSLSLARYDAYLQLPAAVRLWQAVAACKQGDYEKAAQEWQITEKLNPMWTEIPVRLRPLLDSSDRRDVAQSMAQRFHERWKKIRDDFPDYAEAHYQLARLFLWSDRRPEEAIRSARRAVEIDPLNIAYQECLAEALFQNGQHTEALQIILECRKLPRAEWYRCQRIRRCYESGESARAIIEN